MIPRLLKPEDVCLQIIDVQKSLMAKIDGADQVAETIALMVQCAKIMDIPIVANTQYKKGLGPYVKEVEDVIGDVPCFDKFEFSASENSETMAYIEALPQSVQTIILVGVETHICIYQTAVGLLAKGKNVWIVSDGVSSRKPTDHKMGIDRLQQMGASVGPAEMLIYELLGKAGSPEFKAVLPHIIARD